jgi:hypothetical protein
MMIFAAGNGNENWQELIAAVSILLLAYRQRRAQGFWVADVGDFDGNRKSDILWVNDDGTVGVRDGGQVNTAHWVANPGTVSRRLICCRH